MPMTLRVPARGEIYNPRERKRINDFSGMRWRCITPTDVDMLVEFGNRCFIIGEIKRHGRAMERGQELALQRMAMRIGRTCRLLEIWHEASGSAPVDVAHSHVNRWFDATTGAWQWHRPADPDLPPMTKILCDEWVGLHAPEML